ncbi:DVU_1557 family redox protein [Candidatus Formimonas warabiya]|uniref:DUF7479 domain-containing protein n=1 Tax=Formimonas warabiya TaxID=1761012 RepID=A0A3G1KTF7_FORW1|nr:CLJU_RS11820 family redox protein [Candidatus Formimonas warabiya]ATW25739.1 hypothetical protein DCMF_14080 [Candidatus Formimonas warabiya]
MQNEQDTAIMCDKCKVYLKPAKITLSYLGNSFITELPKCPLCGLVYLSEELVKGKVAQVEMSLEDK